jgi:hypothetical protein
MKTLPNIPYLRNIVSEYHRQNNSYTYDIDYIEWLKQFGFKVPIKNNTLEFPDDFSDEDMLMFMLRWS